jgi:hypothetical protein
VREGDLLLDTFRPPADEALDELGSDTTPAKLFERRERRLRQKVCWTSRGAQRERTSKWKPFFLETPEQSYDQKGAISVDMGHCSTRGEETYGLWIAS